MINLINSSVLKKYIAICLLIFLAGSCYAPNRYWLARKNKKVDWEALYKSEIQIMPDTNAVYLYHSVYTGGDSALSHYSFQRYFGNGRVYTSKVFKTMPTEEDFNQMPVHKWNRWEGGQKHYYDITKQGHLRRETFVNNLDGYFWGYARVYPDSIVNFKVHHARGFYGRCCAVKHDVHAVSVRNEVELTNFNVDW